MDLKGWVTKRYLSWLVAALLLWSGCSGVLMESKDSSGKVDRLKLDSGERWSNYDNKPREPYVSSGKHGLDDMSLMLVKEMTF
jgi:hypothetical protein